MHSSNNLVSPPVEVIPRKVRLVNYAEQYAVWATLLVEPELREAELQELRVYSDGTATLAYTLKGVRKQKKYPTQQEMYWGEQHYEDSPRSGLNYALWDWARDHKHRNAQTSIAGSIIGVDPYLLVYRAGHKGIPAAVFVSSLEEEV